MKDPLYPPVSSTAKYFIGDWLLCVRTNSLAKKNGGDSVELEHRLVMLLLLFIDNPNQILNRDWIIATIWKGKVVNYDSLAVAVSQLRKALGDESRSPTYIKTIPGVGYQFIAQAGPVDTRDIDVDVKKTPSYSLGFLKRIFPAMVLVFIAALVFLLKPFQLATLEDQGASDLAVEMRELSAGVGRLLSSTDSKHWLTAIQDARRILQKHPDHAESYMHIAEAKIRLLGDNLIDNNNCVEVQALVNKSIQLNANQISSITRNADLIFWCQQDYLRAEEEYRKAINLSPQDDQVAMQYAQLLLAMGKFAESLEQVNRARQLNPLNYSAPTVVWIYQMQGREDLAMQELTRIQRTEPDNRFSHISAYRVYSRANDQQRAYQHWRWLMEDGGFTQDELLQVDQQFSESQLDGVYRWLLAKQKTQDLGEYTPPLSWARYALAVGDTEQGLIYLRQAFAEKQLALLWAGVDPAYKSIGDHPEFQMMLTNFLGALEK